MVVPEYFYRGIPFSGLVSIYCAFGGQLTIIDIQDVVVSPVKGIPLYFYILLKRENIGKRSDIVTEVGDVIPDKEFIGHL